ncbi:MAG: helix-turn-helix domain-containing protein [Spirochaetaceae bacterium]|jgi:transcriptional regulator with XRE-family HTH domain|nr:helix-turn-helix domain-containing protein [Spirochaetaceae bacterium]
MGGKETEAGEELRSVLSRNIKLFREHRGWSQADLAEKAGISIPFLSDIERGNKWPYPGTLANIAKAFEVDVFELFRRVGAATGPPRDFTRRVVSEMLLAINKAAEKVTLTYLP